MYKIIFTFAAVIIACNAVPTTSRQGRFNKYYAYTNRNDRVPVELNINNMTAIQEVILSTRNTTVIVHGHRGTATNSLNPTVKDAFLTNEDINVIVLDWSTHSLQSYSIATSAVPNVGAALADFLNELISNELITLATLHLVGFDLGAHVVGFTGRELDGNVARITGLSPADSNWGANSNRLRNSDALYVEVIHTDSGGVFGHGVSDAIGDVDFFVNGGSGQPGCFVNNLCSHNRAWEVFAASLTHNHLIGNQCHNRRQVTFNTCRGYTLVMGNNDFTKRGTGMFRVNTGRRYPF